MFLFIQDWSAWYLDVIAAADLIDESPVLMSQTSWTKYLRGMDKHMYDSSDQMSYCIDEER